MSNRISGIFYDEKVLDTKLKSCKTPYTEDGYEIKDENGKKDKEGEKFLNMLNESNNILIKPKFNDISFDDLETKLKEVFDDSINNYHMIYLYSDEFINFIKTLNGIYKKNQKSFDKKISTVRQILPQKQTLKLGSFDYVMTLARQEDITNINCVYLYNFLQFNPKENIHNDMRALEPDDDYYK